mmetsp:Transcript_54503/g.151943  ORF Transcript_54503/g.151943 Transcript_54503/m.151943 type:complete len:205 (-) Transcript_54503:250-864(-)
MCRPQRESPVSPAERWQHCPPPAGCRRASTAGFGLRNRRRQHNWRFPPRPDRKCSAPPSASVRTLGTSRPKLWCHRQRLTCHPRCFAGGQAKPRPTSHHPSRSRGPAQAPPSHQRPPRRSCGMRRHREPGRSCDPARTRPKLLASKQRPGQCRGARTVLPRGRNASGMTLAMAPLGARSAFHHPPWGGARGPREGKPPRRRRPS